MDVAGDYAIRIAARDASASTCGRLYSTGGEGLLRVLQQDDQVQLDGTTARGRLLVDGSVRFSTTVSTLSDGTPVEEAWRLKFAGTRPERSVTGSFVGVMKEEAGERGCRLDLTVTGTEAR